MQERGFALKGIVKLPESDAGGYHEMPTDRVLLNRLHQKKMLIHNLRSLAKPPAQHVYDSPYHVNMLCHELWQIGAQDRRLLDNFLA